MMQFHFYLIKIFQTLYDMTKNYKTKYFIKILKASRD